YLGTLEKEHCKKLWDEFEYDFNNISEQLNIGHSREYFPHEKSIFMDRKTLKQFENDIVSGTIKDNHAPNLTTEEQELYSELKLNNWLLEQEKIFFEYVNDVLKELQK
ncbi:MAG: DUF2220 domain-containing protein, partial [Candidatus Cloacimonetes bacterium]|nr:DUF2220 domain-containing protein [Candidatus Cloacimonadota bacterium]